MLGKGMRRKLAEAQSWKCIWCGEECHNNVAKISKYATIEHIIPRSRGGTDSYYNLAMACFECNSNRGNDHDRSIGDICGEIVHPKKFKSNDYRYKLYAKEKRMTPSEKHENRIKLLRRCIKRTKRMHENNWVNSKGVKWDKDRWFEILQRRLNHEEDKQNLYDAVFNEIYAEV